MHYFSICVVIQFLVQFVRLEFHSSPGTDMFLNISEFPTHHPLFIVPFDFVLCGLIKCFVNLYLLYFICLRGSCLWVLFSHLSCLYCYTTLHFRLCTKSPFNNYTWCCIAAAGNRATIPLENVVHHKTNYYCVIHNNN